jgi:uncharacterized protein (DUF3084 family)
MLSFNSVNPPALPTNEALSTAMTLLAVAADPAGTRARLDELTEQVKVVHSAIAEHDAARLAAEAAQKAADDLVARERKLSEEATRQAVASAAIAGREQELNQREQSLAQREAEVARRAGDLATREKMLVDQRNSMRAALAG